MKFLTFAFLMTIMTSNLWAQEVVEVSCQAPDLHYVNRFNLNLKLELGQDNISSFKDLSLAVDFTRNGFDAPTQWRELSDLLGDFRKVENDVTPNPYYTLQLRNEDKTVFLQLNIDYPGKLNSFIRFADGRTFRSYCERI